MTSSTYKAQCATFAIARDLTGDYRTVTSGEVSRQRPFNLRLVPACRDADARAFRKDVADEARRRRGAQ